MPYICFLRVFGSIQSLLVFCLLSELSAPRLPFDYSLLCCCPCHIFVFCVFFDSHTIIFSVILRRRFLSRRFPFNFSMPLPVSIFLMWVCLTQFNEFCFCFPPWKFSAARLPLLPRLPLPIPNIPITLFCVFWLIFDQYCIFVFRWILSRQAPPLDRTLFSTVRPSELALLQENGDSR